MGFLEPKINNVSFKRNNSGKIVGKPPENPEIAATSMKLPKRDMHKIVKPK